MLNIHSDGMYLRGGALIPAADGPAAGLPSPAEAKKGTIAYRILQSHNTSGNSDALEITFDAMASHDITYVGIIQTARGDFWKEIQKKLKNAWHEQYVLINYWTVAASDKQQSFERSSKK